MNWNEYINLAEKTLSTEFHCDEKLQKILHASIGLATEIEELLVNFEENKFDSTNLLEEIGDLYWYLSIFYREYPDLHHSTRVSQDMFLVNESDPFKITLKLNTLILQIQDLVKKKIYYNKEINTSKMYQIVMEIKCYITALYWKYGISESDICEKNISKLKARYGDKFSSDRAINRDLDNERNILEK